MEGASEKSKIARTKVLVILSYTCFLSWACTEKFPANLAMCIVMRVLKIAVFNQLMCLVKGNLIFKYAVCIKITLLGLCVGDVTLYVPSNVINPWHAWAARVTVVVGEYY